MSERHMEGRRFPVWYPLCMLSLREILWLPAEQEIPRGLAEFGTDERLRLIVRAGVGEYDLNALSVVLFEIKCGRFASRLPVSNRIYL